ncbi:low molecular weight phosphatase family protein [Aquibium sp. A9E412]|uniref:arsenate-mycothiol transferase ArsC n=1 Tax=Aquibium sp. A9E412 TaxID=2976767 RepID=UPI0025B2115E|nr:low molecular weight phosphatase family protein [Aquibium sp. A9E412]MDN2565800.1 low molecular weight phosphatase family protein [Aquibium sp. A9E412]
MSAAGERTARAGEGGLPRSVLFLCGMNVVRSPMAELLARRVLPRTVFVASAGVRAGERDPFVDAVLAEEGLSLGDRQPQGLDDLEDAYFELIVTLAPEAHHAALELTRTMAVDVEYWPTMDPTTIGGTREQILAAYRDVRDRLAARIAGRFAAAAAQDPPDGAPAQGQ